MRVTCEDGGREEERSGEKSNSESRMRTRPGNKGARIVIVSECQSERAISETGEGGNTSE